MKILIHILFFSMIITQSLYNHPELIWKTFETKNFIFHYHEGCESTVNEAAYVAEKIFNPITDYYNYKPSSKTTIVIKDTDDFSNGIAYYYDNKIEIWALPLDFDLRGSHRWLQNVITHEFTHIVQIGKSMKASNRFPAVYFQGFTYEKEKRPDVLYGFPNTMYSVPVPGVAVPPWFAEGAAQIMTPDLSFDYWDTHRDMFLRDMTLNDKLLSLNEMNSFGKKGLGSEAVYNQGFSFSNFLINNYGEDILSEITNYLSKHTYSINKAIYKATGRYGDDIYSEWKNFLISDYKNKLSNVDKNFLMGKSLTTSGTTNIFPKWCPKGLKIAYLSNKDSDYFGQTDLFVYDFNDSTSKKIASSVRYAPTWLNDTTLIFTQRSKPNSNGSKFFNIYKMSLNDEEPVQLTYDSRFRSPSFNKENNLISVISTIDGVSNIYISEIDSINFKKVTNFSNQQYIGSSNWDHLGNLYFDIIDSHGRDIYILELETFSIKKILDNEYDIRNPVFHNENLYFSTDFNGIFNISYYDEDNELKFLTNCYGGSFMPDFHGDKLVYSSFENGGYNIYFIENLQSISNDLIGYDEYKIPQISNLNYLEKNNYHRESKKYSNQMTKLHFVPRLMFDYNTTKYGFYLFSDDMIGKLSLFGGFSLNEIKDLDAFLMFDYKKFRPTFYFNFYWATRHTKQQFDYFNINNELIDNISINNRVNYQIFSSDLGFKMPLFKHKITFAYAYNNYKQNIFQLATQEFITNGENETITSFGKLGFDYYEGHSISIELSTKKIKPHFLGKMLPSNGYSYNFKYAYEFNYFMDGFSIDEEYGTLGSLLKPNNTARMNLDFRYFNKIFKNFDTEISTNIGILSNDNVDDFFYFFGGGIPGIRGYTFYETDLTGSGIMVNTLTLRSLILKKTFINFIDYLDFNKLSLGLVFQFGNAFNGHNKQFIDNMKYSSGLEIRAKGFMFYGYPAALTAEHHFALNDRSETKGKTYLKLLFDF